jgi:large subunit ribosomal protein L9
MEVILLERIARLGQMGDVVRVRDGYARNFLLPQGKALRANEANRKKFEAEKIQLEARNLERVAEARQIGERLGGQSFVVVRQAGETGQLYGSVTTRDLAEVMEVAGFSVARSQIDLTQPLKTIGIHQVRIVLHPEVDTHVSVNVARSEDEAARQARGEDVTAGEAGEAAAESAAESPAADKAVAAEAAESTASP